LVVLEWVTCGCVDWLWSWCCYCCQRDVLKRWVFIIFCSASLKPLTASLHLCCSDFLSFVWIWFYGDLKVVVKVEVIWERWRWWSLCLFSLPLSFCFLFFSWFSSSFILVWVRRLWFWWRWWEFIFTFFFSLCFWFLLPPLFWIF
jgi:hypothetical protein